MKPVNICYASKMHKQKNKTNCFHLLQEFYQCTYQNKCHAIRTNFLRKTKSIDHVKCMKFCPFHNLYRKNRGPFNKRFCCRNTNSKGISFRSQRRCSQEITMKFCSEIISYKEICLNQVTSYLNRYGNPFLKSAPGHCCSNELSHLPHDLSPISFYNMWGSLRFQPKIAPWASFALQSTICTSKHHCLWCLSPH